MSFMTISNVYARENVNRFYCGNSARKHTSEIENYICWKILLQEAPSVTYYEAHNKLLFLATSVSNRMSSCHNLSPLSLLRRSLCIISFPGLIFFIYINIFFPHSEGREKFHNINFSLQFIILRSFIHYIICMSFRDESRWL